MLVLITIPFPQIRFLHIIYNYHEEIELKKFKLGSNIKAFFRVKEIISIF